MAPQTIPSTWVLFFFFILCLFACKKIATPGRSWNSFSASSLFWVFFFLLVNTFLNIHMCMLERVEPLRRCEGLSHDAVHTRPRRNYPTPKKFFFSLLVSKLCTRWGVVPVFERHWRGRNKNYFFSNELFVADISRRLIQKLQLQTE